MRPLIAIAALAIGGHLASAGGLPRHLGLYAPQSAASLPMLDSKLDVAVRGPIVEITVTQVFKNDSEHPTEATYIFPLPTDAAVTAMAIDVGTRKIHAAVERRDHAQQRYEEAVAAGLGASLLEQERSDVFTQTVSAIPPHGTVSVTLRFDSTARYADGTWELVLPLVVAPRYVPGTASGRPTTGGGRAPDTERAPDASRVTPHAAPGAGGKTEISITFQSAVDSVSSPTHDLHQRSALYTIEDPTSDHDAIVRWRAKAPSQGWVEADADGGFAAVVVEAPAAKPHTDAARCTLLVDRAATTHGDGDLVERALVRALLGAMASNDRVAATGLEFRSPEQLQRALDEAWAKPGGAFDVTKTLAAVRADGAPVVLVSDGLVADDAAAIAAARKTGVPVHVIGFGPAPNRSLLAAIANATGGTVRFAVIGDDLDALSRAVVADVAAPPAALVVSWGTLAATDVVPATLPRIGAGQSALVIARVKRAQTANARARGDLFALASFSAGAPPPGATSAHGALGRRWARIKLDELVAGGNAVAIANHALAYGLVSPYTSLVAIGDEVVVEGGVKHTRAVPVSVPAGMRWQEVKRETTLDLSTTKSEGTKVGEGTAGKPDVQPVKTTPPPKPADKPPADTLADKQKTHAHDPSKHEPPRTPIASGPVASQPIRDHRDHEASKKASKSDEEDAPTSTRQGVDDDGDRANHRRPAPGGAAPSASTGPAQAPPAVDLPEHIATRDADGDGAADTEAVSEVSLSSSHRLYRLSASLGGGVSLVNRLGRATGVVVGRIEFGGRTMLGGEASLWLVDGAGAEGSLLATVARRGFLVPRLELGAGFGIHLGDGAGPAVELVLRVHTPLRHIALYLRYDGALVFHDATRDGENTETVGVEAGF